MAAPRKYADEYRETIITLVQDDGLTIADACRRLAQGHNGLEPINLPEKTAGQWIQAAERDPRPDLTTLALPDILNTTARGLFDLVNADIYRMKRQKGQSDPETLLTLARTLKELQPLASHKPQQGKADAEPTGVAGRLAVAPEPAAQGNTQTDGASPVSARSAS